jgi:hypothetical protein
MKTKSKCIGCQAIKLVNDLGLCKRCNRHSHDFISNEEMIRLKREREEMLEASLIAKKLKKEAEAEKAAEAEEEKAGEEGEEGEEGEAAEETGGEADSGDASESE